MYILVKLVSDCSTLAMKCTFTISSEGLQKVLRKAAIRSHSCHVHIPYNAEVYVYCACHVTKSDNQNFEIQSIKEEFI